MRVWVAGGRPLRGSVSVSPAKNAVLPQLAAALLTREPVRLTAPALGDVDAMCDLLRLLGASVETEAGVITVRAAGPLATEAPPSAMARMRASVLVLGPLLARCGRAILTPPGGCAIGTRPIDLHLLAMRALGATVRVAGPRLEVLAEGGLRGADVVLPYPSHTATENAMLAATLARGVTRIIGAAREPEVADTARLLTAMGVPVEGAGGPVVVVHGRAHGLCGAAHIPIPDRVEAGTLLLAAAATGGRVTVAGVRPEHLAAPLRRLAAMGVRVAWDRAGLTVEGLAPGRLRSADVRTQPYPGFPTDLQPPFSVLAVQAQGESLISETVFDGRLGHMEALRRMGADVLVAGRHACLRGPARLRGAALAAADLRGGAALLLAAAAAHGESSIEGFEHVARGYVDLPGKLRALGAVLAVDPRPPADGDLPSAHGDGNLSATASPSLVGPP